MNSHRKAPPLPPSPEHPRSAFSFYDGIRVLSLDVVWGALCMMYLFVFCLQSPVPWSSYLVLGLSVWLIYTLDHLWDAYKIPHLAHTPRHRFHQRFFRPLAFLWVFTLLATGTCTYLFLPLNTLCYGLFVSVLVCIHFLLGALEGLRSVLFFQKETRIALVYTLGVSTAPFSLLLPQLGQDPKLWILAFMSFCLAWANLLIISHYEHEIDSQDAHISLVRGLGLEASHRLIKIIFGAFWISGGIGFYLGNPRYRLAIFILALMALVLHQVFQGGPYFTRRENYRAWSDAIFYLPGVLIFLGDGAGF